MASHRSPPPRPRSPTYKIVTVGVRSPWFRDAHHAFLRIPWWAGLGIIIAAFLAANVLFGIAYARIGGVANARPQSVADGFFFSIQTMATIGYGAMYPQSTAAHVLVVIEAVMGLLFTALSTGLIFAKFSRPIGRIAFSHCAVISPMNGVPTLMFRVGNERASMIAEATIHVDITRTMKTTEGVTFYRLTDLPLVRTRSAAIARSWNVMHEINASSPLYGYDPERMEKEELELIVSLSGMDDTSSQPVQGRHQYEHSAILWGARLVDVLSESADGNLVLDIRNFHSVAPTQPSESFPYPRPQPD